MLMQWIPVTERLPDENSTNHMYLVTIGNIIKILPFINGKFVTGSLGTVDAWMPLPEPDSWQNGIKEQIKELTDEASKPEVLKTWEEMERDLMSRR